MLVISPITSTEDLNEGLLLAAMQANFDRALDARYGVSDGTVRSAFIHPLADLTADLFVSGCHQVAQSAASFGTTFSSGGMSYNTDAV